MIGELESDENRNFCAIGCSRHIYDIAYEAFPGLVASRGGGFSRQPSRGAREHARPVNLSERRRKNRKSDVF
jgi:hypothetical protein